MSDCFEWRARIADACDIAYGLGGIEGDHHRMWVIDQMLRALLGDEAYNDWVKAYEESGDYKWDTGIAP